MPAYNAAQTLRKTYDEVMAQEIVDQIILVDDKSVDETVPLAKELPNVIVYAHDRVKAEELDDYLSLADEKWKKRICIRSSDNIYNQSLVAGMIANHGMEATEKWLKGLVANMARPPQGGDRIR